MTTIASDWDDIGAAVDYIRALRRVDLALRDSDALVDRLPDPGDPELRRVRGLLRALGAMFERLKDLEGG